MNQKKLFGFRYYILFLFVCCLFPKIAYSQFPTGKNIQVARNEIKQLMKAKGYTFIKKENHDDIKIEVLFFAEEFMITLHKNDYDNVEAINFSSDKKKLIDRLKNTFNYPQWKFVENTSDRFGVDNIYYYKNYRIKVPEGSVHQFIVYEKDED